MDKSIFKNHIRLSVEGVNIKRLLKNIIKNDIEIYNLKQINYKKIEFNIKSTKLKQIKLILKDYRFNIINYFGFSFINKFSHMHMGIIIGLIIFLSALFFNSNFLSQIVINGTDRIENKSILTFLSENNIKANSFFKQIDCEKIETLLENNFNDISFVSVIKKGTNVIVNIKEKLYADEILEKSNLISKFNGQILSIECSQGTPRVKVGDSVKEGDVIIEGVIENNGEQVNCKAIGTVSMKVWYESSYKFEYETIERVRTGNCIVNSYYKIFNKKQNIKVKVIPYKNYDLQIKERYLFENNILPIKIYKEIFYEIQENVKKNDFSLQKDAIIKETIKNALNKVPSKVKVLNQFTNIVDTETGKIVTSYVETIQSFS